MRYSAFISYNHRDRKEASWLLKALESYRVPKRLHGQPSAVGILGSRLPPVFQDRAELAASSNLAESVRAALVESASLIIVCSPNGARSKWVNEEIRAFVAMGRRDRIQCLIIGGEPNAATLPDSDPELECLPPALFENGGTEPLASDIRPGKDGRAAARLKLLAGIMGVGYDELRQREASRRQRQLAIVAGASAIGFVVMAGLAVSAVLARNDAILQRDIARQKTMTAERTVEFVQSLFEVSDPSEAKGSQISALAILDKGAARIADSLGDEPSVKAELMTTLSNVYLGLGSLRKGDAIIRNSLRLQVDDPGVAARQLLALGNSETRQGEYAAAAKTFSRALLLARDSQRGNPALIAPILVGRGEARSAAEDTKGADADIRQALQADLATFGPRHPAVARDLEALGLNALAEDRLDDARSMFERALAIRIPVQGLAHPRVSENYNELGSIAYLQRDSPAAEALWSRALKSDELVLGPDHPDVAISINNVARVMLERRGFAEAWKLLVHARDISLRQRSATHDDLAFILGNLGLAERGLGQAAAATATLQAALVAAEIHKHRNRAPILADLADLACDQGVPVRGLALLDRAAPLMLEDYPDDPWRQAWVTNTRGKCLLAAGRRREGKAAIEASMADIRARWPKSTLFGALAEKRLQGTMTSAE
ncbi:Tfp pilus assembly protein PilF [Polymorphobacter multimanifer]|uniref:Tfp pilus assembly protein PilF n=1 Tax=Polymorphobacter multimanifer TaxID=1070431 RepID=A0A841LIL9_9SPHN|nr:Tfp pilus assembly protein PilF [Polymorphobacter multimanifer]